MGDIKKLTWAFVSGKELVEEIGEDKLKGTAKITLSVRKDLTPDQLKNQSSNHIESHNERRPYSDHARFDGRIFPHRNDRHT